MENARPARIWSYLKDIAYPPAGNEGQFPLLIRKCKKKEIMDCMTENPRVREREVLAGVRIGEWTCNFKFGKTRIAQVVERLLQRIDFQSLPAFFIHRY